MPFEPLTQSFVSKNPGARSTGHSSGSFDFNAEEEWCVAAATPHPRRSGVYLSA